MISVLSILTSVKDYVEITHKLIETDPNLFQIKSYDEIGSLLTYLIFSIKELLIGFFSLNWMKNIWTLPIIVPDIASSMISEISILDGSFHNIFNILENPLDYGQQNVLVSLLEKFFIGLLNSVFLVLPTSVSHIITLRRFIMQGVEIGYIAGLGTIAGNLLWIASILFGWRFFVIPWLSFDIFRYIFGFILLVKYLWDCTKERKILLEDVNKSKVFLLNFLLALTEQTCIYPFITNISFSPESSILETFPTENLFSFIALHSSYLLGIFAGSFTLLLFSYWFWENPAFTFFLWIQTNSKVNLTKRGYYKFFNNFFTYLTMLAAIGSIPYYGLDYTLTKPLGLVPQDRILTEKPLNSNDSETRLKELSFLNVQPTNLDLRSNDTNPRAPRRRWKERFKKYEAFDISLYDQGNYDFLTIEDLNYGFDRFWFKRKMRNHSTSFKVFPGPIMRDIKKKLASPFAIMGQEDSNKNAFFTLLFEQYYHPNFHRIINKKKPSFPSFASEGTPSPTGTAKNSKPLALVSLPSTSNSNLNNRQIGFTATRKDQSIFGMKKNTINPNWNNHSDFSALRKFVRKVNTRIKKSEIFFDLTEKSNSLVGGQGFKETVKGKNNFIYSKLWKHLYSNIWRGSSPTSTFAQSTSSSSTEKAAFFIRNPFRSLSARMRTPETTINQNLNVLMKKENQYKNLQKFYNIDNKQSLTSALKENFKKTLSREKLSKKDRQILRYRTRLVKEISPTPFLALKSGGSTAGSNFNYLEKRASSSPSGEERSLLYPLNFYLQKEQAFNKKLKFYGSTIFRKFSVGNNAPYFRTILKRGFYYYKKNLRWKRTEITASLRKGLRKSSRNPRKLIKNNASIANSYNQAGPGGNPRLATQAPPLSGRGLASAYDVSISSSGLPGEQRKAEESLHIQSSDPLLQKPTHFYSDIGKRYSRYRFQIYKDVLQHWYYTPFNRLLLKLDVDAFINRQPRNQFLTKKEEQLLHLRRILLSEHYDTLRWYTFMEHYKSMKNKIGGNKSFASRIYNQQFQGTFKKIRHLFAVTPSLMGTNQLNYNFAQSPVNKGDVVRPIGQQDRLPQERSGTSLDLRTVKNSEATSQQILQSVSLFKETPSLLTFDQPLYNEYSNSSKAINKKTGKISFKSIFHEELFVPLAFDGSNERGLLSTQSKEGTKNNQLFTLNYNEEDLITHSTSLVGEYLLKTNSFKKEYLKTLISENKYSELLNFLYKNTNIKRLEDLEKLGFPISHSKMNEFIQSPEGKSIYETEKEQSKNLQVPLNKTSLLLGKEESQLFQEELWFQYLRQSKKRLNNKKFLKKYLKYRVELSEKRILAKEKQLEKRLEKLNSWLIPMTFLSNNFYKGSLSSTQKETQRIDVNKENIILTRGLVKSLKKGFLSPQIVKKTGDKQYKRINRTLSMFNTNASMRKQVKTEQKIFISLETIKKIFAYSPPCEATSLGKGTPLLGQKGPETTNTSLGGGERQQVYSKKNYYEFLNKINYKGKSMFSKFKNAFSKKTKPLYYFLKQRPERMKNVFWKYRQKVKDKIKKQRKIQPPPVNLLILSGEKNETGQLISTSTPFNLYKVREEEKKLTPVAQTEQGEIIYKYKEITKYGGEKDFFRFKKSENNSIFNNLVKKEFLTSPLGALGREETQYKKSKKKGPAFLSLKKVKFITKQKIKKLPENEKKRIIKSGGAISNFIKKLPASSVQEKETDKKDRDLINLPYSALGSLQQTVNAKEKDNSFSFVGDNFEIPAKKSYRKKKLIKTKSSSVKNSQKKQKKNFKFLKRRIYKKMKLQKFAKQLRRIKSNIQLQLWWWQTYLPKFELKIENLTSVSFEKQVSQKASLSPAFEATIQEDKTTERKEEVGTLENKGDNETSSLINNLYKNLLIKDLKTNNPSTSFGGDFSRPSVGTPKSSFDVTLQKDSSAFKKEVLINSLPFYAGWDDSLRKLVVTNRTLSRRDAGFNLKNLNLFNNLQPLQKFYPNNDLIFTKAPIFGLNESLFLYLNDDLPFKTYSLQQYNPNYVSFYTPIAWRRFEFRHSILNNWLKNNLFEQSSSSIVSNSGQSSSEKSPRSANSVPLSTNKTKLDDKVKTGETLISRKILKKIDKNELYLKHIKLQEKQQDLINLIEENKKEKRIFQKFILRRNKKHKFKLEKKLNLNNVQERKPYGTLLIDVLPSHYLSLSNTNSRLPRYRYLKYRLIKNKNSKEINLATKEYNNSIKKGIDFSIINENNILTKSFTLRKKNKTKRKFHRKVVNKAEGLITPQRRKFLIFKDSASVDYASQPPPKEIVGLPSKESQLFVPNRTKQSGVTIDKKSGPGTRETSLNVLMKDKFRWRPINEKEFSLSQRKTNIKVDTTRRRKLRTKVFRQVYKQITRFQPRYGGYMWPGNYPKLDITQYPFLEKKEIVQTSNEVIKRKVNYKDKKNVSTGILVPVGSNYKYLIKKHNILVIKKKLEKAQRSNKIRERTNVLKAVLQKS